MDYIADTLGIKVTRTIWDGVDGLPYFLIDRYNFTYVILDNIHCLFIGPKVELDTLPNIKKNITNIQKFTQLPIVLELAEMTPRLRKSLINARIPFVARKCHIYLPFMGVALDERYASILTPAETLSPSAQLLLFYYIYQNNEKLYASEASSALRISPMQVSRAVKQLTALGIVSAQKDGVRVVMSAKETGAMLFEKAKSYLLNPVSKKIYIERTELPNGLPLSSYNALSELTMLGGSQLKTFAYYGKKTEITGADALVDSDVQVEIEIWRYNPILLSKNPSIADVLSLATSLLSDNDPRVEQSVEELLSNIWRKNLG